MQRLFPLLCALLSALFIASCMDDEDYTLSPQDRLLFSTDTVAFDTIISGSPTNTYAFKVYNPASKALRIPLVKLEKGGASPFKVNVDGSPLVEGQATDFEIAARDSLMVYLMANVPEEDSDTPVEVSDKLVFTTESGVAQEVVLTAAGQAVQTLTGTRITAATTFSLARPYRIMDSLVIEEGATLTLAAGTRLYFHPNASLIVHGSLHIAGTLEQPVQLRGDRLGNMFAGQPYDRIPGQWGGIVLKSTSYDNHISYADIHSGTWGIQADSSDVGRTKLVLENSILHNVSRHALDVRMAKVQVGNSQITNAGGDCVRVRGGDVSLTHCTIARFYVFTGGDGHALDFANYEGLVRLPLSQLQVRNSLITGYQSDEIMGSPNSQHSEDAFNYYFAYSLLNTPASEDDAHIAHCLYDTGEGAVDEEGNAVERDKNFTPLPDLDALTFSFALSPYSRAVGRADAGITSATYPYDRLGRPRGSVPDMGCYQHEEAQPESTSKGLRRTLPAHYYLLK